MWKQANIHHSSRQNCLSYLEHSCLSNNAQSHMSLLGGSLLGKTWMSACLSKSNAFVYSPENVTDRRNIVELFKVIWNSKLNWKPVVDAHIHHNCS